MAVSQKQIAKKLGVSIALVSRVLSGKATNIGIAPDTIKRVLVTAQKMGYVPSAAALALKGKTTRTLGVVVYDFKDPFFGALIEQLQMQARAHGYSLVLAGFLKRIPDKQDLHPLHKHAIDGLIVLGSDNKAWWLEDFRPFPVARIGHGGAEQSVCVKIDEENAGRLLITHLIQNGRKRLLFLSANLPAHRIRQKTFERVAASCGVDLLTEESTERDAFSAGMQVALDRRHDVDALLCATDQVAMGALHALNKAGIYVPEQISITGFDDIPAAARFLQPITTIRQPIKEMVRQAFAAIVQPSAPQEILLPGQLIRRTTA